MHSEFLNLYDIPVLLLDVTFRAALNLAAVCMVFMRKSVLCPLARILGRLVGTLGDVLVPPGIVHAIHGTTPPCQSLVPCNRACGSMTLWGWRNTFGASNSSWGVVKSLTFYKCLMLLMTQRNSPISLVALIDAQKFTRRDQSLCYTWEGHQDICDTQWSQQRIS